ncbi:MAG TPA: TonB-dependent receptor plug domain-containing protein [Vicinamibacterales bacterium]
MQTLSVPVDPELHFSEVVSVSPDARSQFESFQPTSVLSGQELSKQLESSLGATLESQPGVAARSFGPAPSRPVIRGLDGDRVLILQDGQRLGDLSTPSGDHSVPINPASAQRIEVVRGPATLLYGSNAIGGLVNVITDEIPTKPQHGASGTFTFDLGSRISRPRWAETRSCSTVSSSDRAALACRVESALRSRGAAASLGAAA